MIRFINLDGQIDDFTKNFAFYNTIDDRFVEVEGNQMFNNLEDLEEAYRDDRSSVKVDLDRLISVIPKNYFNEPVKI